MQNVAISFMVSYFFSMEIYWYIYWYIVLVVFVVRISITDIISSHAITEVSAILFRYLLYNNNF